MMTLTLQEVIIVGNISEQAKFSELTLDMFRMLQTLEREPQDELAQVKFYLTKFVHESFLPSLCFTKKFSVFVKDLNMQFNSAVSTFRLGVQNQ